MVISEKALVQRMKEAYKGWGYTVAVRSGGKWAVYTPNWMVQIDGQGNVPNAVLALIVLHMGELPEQESAYRIYKIDTGPVIQKEVFAVVDAEIKKLVERAAQTGNFPQTIQRTKLTLGSWQVWQKEQDLEIYMMDPSYTRLIDSKHTQAVDDFVFAEGDISCVYVRREIGAGEKEHIDHLAAMQWIET